LQTALVTAQLPGLFALSGRL